MDFFLGVFKNRKEANECVGDYRNKKISGCIIRPEIRERTCNQDAKTAYVVTYNAYETMLDGIVIRSMHNRFMEVFTNREEAVECVNSLQGVDKFGVDYRCKIREYEL
jgi:hypothetical protein